MESALESEPLPQLEPLPESNSSPESDSSPQFESPPDSESPPKGASSPESKSPQQSKPPKTFPKFMNLPFELRAAIWEWYCPEITKAPCVLPFQAMESNMNRLPVTATEAVPNPILSPGLWEATKRVQCLLDAGEDSRKLVLQRLPDEIPLNIFSGYSQSKGVVRLKKEKDIVAINDATLLLLGHMPQPGDADFQTKSETIYSVKKIAVDAVDNLWVRREQTSADPYFLDHGSVTVYREVLQRFTKTKVMYASQDALSGYLRDRTLKPDWFEASKTEGYHTGEKLECIKPFKVAGWPLSYYWPSAAHLEKHEPWIGKDCSMENWFWGLRERVDFSSVKSLEVLPMLYSNVPEERMTKAVEYAKKICGCKTCERKLSGAT